MGLKSPGDFTFDPVQPVADGPVGPYVALSPVGSYGMSEDMTTGSVGPVGPFITCGPVGLYGTKSPGDFTIDPVQPGG